MPLTWTNVEKIYRGPRTLVYADCQLDSTYVVGGYAVVPGDVGLAQVDIMLVDPSGPNRVVYVKNNNTSGLIKVFAATQTATNSILATMVDSGVRDYSNITVPVLIVGR